MKGPTVIELREKTDRELEGMLSEGRAKLRDLRFRVARRELKHVREIRVVRDRIARVLTIVRSRAMKGK